MLHPDIIDVVPQTKWYVVIVRNHHERSTKERLDAMGLGLETYVPLQKVFRVYCDRRKWVDVVAIPGVVFVGVRGSAALKSLREASVPLRFLRTPDKKEPAIVPEHEFRRMKDFIERAEEEITLGQGRFAKGSVAHVFRGPFKGMEVIIVAEEDEHKAKIGIELEMLGRTLCTTISKADLLSEIEWRRSPRRVRKLFP